MTFTLCCLVIHFNVIVALPCVCVCTPDSFLEAEWQSIFMLHFEVFAVNPSVVMTKPTCAAGVCVCVVSHAE